MSIVDKLKRRMLLDHLASMVEPPGEDLVTLGSDYGYSTVPKSALKPGAVAVCVGAGEDITFDVDLNDAGLDLYCLDPTPRSKAHVDMVLQGAAEGKDVVSVSGQPTRYDLSNFNPNLFHFMPVGIWISDERQKFFAPKKESKVSHSIVNLEETEDFFEADCVTLQTLQKSLSGPVQILKLDIMGAEYEVIKNLVQTQFWVPVICVELDECQFPRRPGAKKRVLEIVSLLKGAGYKFVHLKLSNATFVRNGHPV